MSAGGKGSTQRPTDQKNGQLAMTTFNGQKKKMKNSTESQKYKTVLAPNAPWPKTQEKKPYRKREVGLKTVKIAREDGGLDYFEQTRKELNQCKIAAKSRIRDKTTGRFKSS